MRRNACSTEWAVAASGKYWPGAKRRTVVMAPITAGIWYSITVSEFAFINGRSPVSR